MGCECSRRNCHPDKNCHKLLDVEKTTSILERLDCNLAHGQKNLSVRRCVQVLRGFHRGQGSLCVPCKQTSFRRPAQGIRVRGKKHQAAEIGPATGADLRAAKGRLANRTLAVRLCRRSSLSTCDKEQQFAKLCSCVREGQLIAAGNRRFDLFIEVDRFFAIVVMHLLDQLT